METADIFLVLVSLVVGMLGWFLSRLASTVDKLEQNINNCQANMPLNYVLKEDFTLVQHSLDKKLDKMNDKLDSLIKSN